MCFVFAVHKRAMESVTSIVWKSVSGSRRSHLVGLRTQRSVCDTGERPGARTLTWNSDGFRVSRDPIAIRHKRLSRGTAIGFNNQRRERVFSDVNHSADHWMANACSTVISPMSYHPSSCRSAIAKRIAGFLVCGSSSATRTRYFPGFNSGGTDTVFS